MKGSDQILAALLFYRLWQKGVESPHLDIQRIELNDIKIQDDNGLYTSPPMVVMYHSDSLELGKPSSSNYAIVRVDALNLYDQSGDSVITDKELNLSELLKIADCNIRFAIEDVSNSNRYLKSSIVT
ncbi:hypothetical protein [Legionella sp. W05-934-2]|jgi:hypothetical protein|uniref:hypothetical protein n=1 Tax=Legionella sp. W05-934-2 TaxID=1198649 RepID=UPI0034618ABC